MKVVNHLHPSPEQAKAASRQVLERLIDQELLVQQAIDKKLDRDPVAQRRLAAARERILGDMLVESVVEKAVTPNAIRESLLPLRNLIWMFLHLYQEAHQFLYVNNPRVHKD